MKFIENFIDGKRFKNKCNKIIDNEEEKCWRENNIRIL